jgi:protein-arginine kinase activator protein McsA
MMNPLCDQCGESPATVFITKIVDNQASKERLCEQCARDKALGEGWIQQLTGEDAAQLENMPLDEIVMSLFANMDAPELVEDDGEDDDQYSLVKLAQMTEFPADEDLADEMDEAEAEEELAHSFFIDDMEDEDDEIANTTVEDDDDDEFVEESTSDGGGSASNPFAGARPREVPVVRCPKCETTWDRLRQDSRVGCAQCYEVFREQLDEVMSRLQNANQHIGKMPRAATKRRRRLEHLRARRDHRLAMLQSRLEKAIAAEDYEEAAKLRDKIKMVSSTIVSNES